MFRIFWTHLGWYEQETFEFFADALMHAKDKYWAAQIYCGERLIAHWEPGCGLKLLEEAA